MVNVPRLRNKYAGQQTASIGFGPMIVGRLLATLASDKRELGRFRAYGVSITTFAALAAWEMRL